MPFSDREERTCFPPLMPVGPAPGRRETANENPDKSSPHVVVERVDIAGHRFVLCGWVVVVGMVNSNRILRHDVSCNGLRMSRLPCLHHIVERPDRNSTKRPRNFPSAASQFLRKARVTRRSSLLPDFSRFPTRRLNVSSNCN